MMERRRWFRRVFLTVIVFALATGQSVAHPRYVPVQDTTGTSSREKAIAFIDAIRELEPSAWWPNIKPALFLQNLKTNIHQPVSIYPGNGTNFCGYGALTYLLLLDDPLGYAKLLLQLYREGKATFGDTHFTPSAAIKKAAGTFHFKGKLDIRPAEQMWYLCLADHFKGYLNILNRKYDPEDEDKLWASVNYAKFNRMVRSLLSYKVNAKGADLFRPRVGDLYTYIEERMKTGTVVLYINNRIVHKKNHAAIKLGIPTHFIVAEKIMQADGMITFVYWDYGGKTQLQLPPSILKRIVFVITYCTKRDAYVN